MKTHNFHAGRATDLFRGRTGTQIAGVGSLAGSPIDLTTSPADGDILVYDSSTDTWVLTNTDDFGEAGSVPRTVFHDVDVLRGFTLTKQGAVISRGGSGSWKEALVESPNVFWSPEAGKYCMVYAGYTGVLGSPTVAAIGVATSTDLTTWTEYASNPFFSASGSGADSAGVTGPFVWYEDGRYILYYIGLTATGYEAGTKSMSVAISTDWIPGTNAGTWTRTKGIINPTSGWRSAAIYHPNVVKRDGVYYNFFNASNGSLEQIGYATSTDLVTWTVDDTNSPVLAVTAAAWDSATVGDPWVFRDDATWYMAYYGYDGATHAKDGYAFTSDANFPLGWTKFAGNPILSNGSAGSIDALHAHKPSIWISAVRFMHFYTAADDSTPEVRQIALAEQVFDDTSGVTGFATPSGGYGAAAAGSATTALRSDAVLPKPTAADVDFTADVTTNNATTGHHGLLPKLDGNTAHVLLGDGTYGTIPGVTAAAVRDAGRWEPTVDGGTDTLIFDSHTVVMDWTTT